MQVLRFIIINQTIPQYKTETVSFPYSVKPALPHSCALTNTIIIPKPQKLISPGEKPVTTHPQCVQVQASEMDIALCVFVWTCDSLMNHFAVEQIFKWKIFFFLFSMLTHFAKISHRVTLTHWSSHYRIKKKGKFQHTDTVVQFPFWHLEGTVAYSLSHMEAAPPVLSDGLHFPLKRHQFSQLHSN